MVKYSLLPRIIACAAALVFTLPMPPVGAAPQASHKESRGTDITLVKGALTGKLLSANGAPVDGAVVTVSKDGEQVGQTITTADGIYTVGELSPGIHPVSMADGQFPVRLWSPEAAPASARSQLIVAQTAVRGQLAGFGGTSLTTVVSVGAAIGAGTLAAIKIQENNDLQDEIDELQTP